MKITIEVPDDVVEDYSAYHGYADEVEDRQNRAKHTKKKNPQTKLEFFKLNLERHIKHGALSHRRNEAEKVAREKLQDVGTVVVS